ncbi:MAG: glutamine--fructose-6-phosphate transaminase (isomerizing) [Clostridiales bacterium]|nr:glutamine--fructose-6-phosphate transaminase (isomerizing) [Clostridiales bacterium]
MCGIVGYIGARQAAPILLAGLEKLEYRGYDSAGICVVAPEESKLSYAKCLGKIINLRTRTRDGTALPGGNGIGHTRWATHGTPSETNSHPHLSGDGRIALVHNGIIENYQELAARLRDAGYVFRSETDSETIVHLLEDYYDGNPVAALRRAAAELRGSFALGVLFADFPGRLYALRKASPLIIGMGEGENFIASDVPALLTHTRKIIRMQEGSVAELASDGIKLWDADGCAITPNPETIDWDANSAQKDGHAHYTIKEIHEQPYALRRTISPRLRGDEIDFGFTKISEQELRDCNCIYLLGCGSAYHVGMVGKYYLEKLCRVFAIPVLASEFRYAHPVVTEKTLTIVVSQSGETADAREAMHEAQRLGSKVISIVNVKGSAIAVESDEVIYTHAGPEIGVATTKAYNVQLNALLLFALYMARVRGTAEEIYIKEEIHALQTLPEKMESFLFDVTTAQFYASVYCGGKDIYFLGRNVDYALALEGSLKLKEISYIHSEAYAAGELKHGTLALMEEGTPVVAVCTYTPLLDKMISNIVQVKARGAKVLAIVREGETGLDFVADYVWRIPASFGFTQSALTILPMQLFAYYVALQLDREIDQPRNLAKSVTVE